NRSAVFSMTHPATIRKEIIERVLSRRGRLHLFDRLAPAHTALVAIDMQGTFLAPGAPAEVPRARTIVDTLNGFADALRGRGVIIIWVTHANERRNGGSDWPAFFDNFAAAELRGKTLVGLSPGNEGQRLWPALRTEPGDLHVRKNRYSALIPGASDLAAL